MAKTKECGKCGKVKPLTLFIRDTSRPDGRTGWCMECRRARAKASYKRDKLLAAKAAKAKAKPKVKAKAKARARRKPAAEHQAAA